MDGVSGNLTTSFSPSVAKGSCPSAHEPQLVVVRPNEPLDLLTQKKPAPDEGRVHIDDVGGLDPVDGERHLRGIV